MKLSILVVIPTLNDDPTETINSLQNQTVKVSKILVAVGSKSLYQKLISTGRGGAVEYFYVKPNFQDPLGKRVASALNYALSKVNLNDYDYLLRLDADAILPARFIEENLKKVNAHYIGKAGYAMLLKMECFLRVFNGQFAEVGAEDSYIGLKLLSQGYKVESWALPPKLKRKSGAHHTWRYYFTRGIEMYKLGYEPIHVTETLRHDFRNIFTILGYFTAITKKFERYEFSNWVFRAQLRRLFYGKEINKSMNNKRSF